MRYSTDFMIALNGSFNCVYLHIYTGNMHTQHTQDKPRLQHTMHKQTHAFVPKPEITAVCSSIHHNAWNEIPEIE